MSDLEISRFNFETEKEKQLRAVTTQIIRKLQEQRRMFEYQKDPALWLTERFKEDIRGFKWSQYSPKYDVHQWDGDRDPLYTAWEGLSKFQDVALLSATSTGKTYGLARIVLWWLDVFPNASVITVAPREAQLTEHLWSEISRIWEKFHKIRPNSKRVGLKIYKDIKHPKYFQSARAIGQVAQVKAGEESATSFQGEHREYLLFITEETPGIHPAIMKAIENTKTGTKNAQLSVGNPDNVLDQLSLFADTPGVLKIRASGYDHPNIVVGREVIPGAVSSKSIEMRRLKYGEESDFYKSRVRGIAPEQGKDSLLKLSWLKQANDKDFTVVNDYSYNAVGVDVANSETGDCAATAYGKSNTLHELHEFQCPDATHLAYNLVMDSFQLAEEFGNKPYHDYHIPTIYDYEIMSENVGVDTVGVGTSTINSLKHPLNIYAIALQGGVLEEAIEKDDQGKILYDFNNLRSQMYWELREDLRTGKLKMLLPEKVFMQLCKELLAHQYSTKSGKIVVMKKEEVQKLLSGKSPNLADAVVYWNWIRKGYYNTGGYSPVYGGK